MILCLWFAAHGWAQPSEELRNFFRQQIGLTDDQISQIANGHPVARILATAPNEIVVFGAAFVHSTPDAYVRHVFDIDRMSRSPGYLGAGTVSVPPKLSELDGFQLEAEDLRSLRYCRPGDCDVQLPRDVLQDVQAAPGAANDRMKRMAMDILAGYQQQGNRALNGYHDSDQSLAVHSQLKALLARSEALPIYLPELSPYLLNYPNIEPGEVESTFFWERVSFGMKPTLRLNHAISFRSTSLKEPVRVVAVKQLYASHYFQLALDLSACVQGKHANGSDGFYLISLKGSMQQGLSGWKGSLLRMLIVSKTRTAQERALVNIKTALEGRR